MQTVIKSVDVAWNGVGAKKWGKATVKHDAGNGEKTQTIVSFKNPDVFKRVQEMVGQTVDVEIVKDGDYWQWKSVTASGGTPSGPTSSSPATSGQGATRVMGSNYETKEERAKRQVLIVKQSSLSAAVATLTPGAKAQLDPKVVTDLAQQYADWVFEEDKSIEGMDNDLPF